MAHIASEENQIVQSFLNTLEKLNSTSERQIHILTTIAKDGGAHANAITNATVRHAMQVGLCGCLSINANNCSL